MCLKGFIVSDVNSESNRPQGLIRETYKQEELCSMEIICFSN